MLKVKYIERFFKYVTILLLFLNVTCAIDRVHKENFPKKVNILFVVVDDLRPMADENINLPNFKKLSLSGINFRNAFAQQALCAPSRNSLLTGRRPDSLHLYDFYSYWREGIGNFTTIPQFFKENGYDTYSVGKVFHPGKSSNFTDDSPYSWSTSPYHPPTDRFKDAPVCKNKKTKKLQRNLVCPVNVNGQPGKSLPDLQSLEYAVDILRMRKYSEKPMFLAVGFHKPHIPLKFPEEYLDRVNWRDIKPPKVPFLPPGIPTVSWHPWTDVRKRDDINRLNISFPFGTMPKAWTRRIKQSYFAAALYIDDLIGILMSHVDTRDTIVVLTSDHGWSLGENGLWAKYSNFDYALKVPLVIKVPGMAPKDIDTPVELIDIFPTLVDITKLADTIPKCKRVDNTKLCFEGKSLLPLVEDTTNTISEEYVAFSQYPRPSVYPQATTDKPRLKDIKIMGYSVRTKRLRYTEWVSFNSTLFQRNWNKIFGAELYDHMFDPIESKNLSLDPEYKQVRKYLSKLLRSKVG